MAFRRLVTAIFLASFWLSATDTQAADGINFFKNYFVTGDYVVGSVDILPQQAVLDENGNPLVSGIIEISGVPPNADILAAFLLWETVTNGVATSTAARFRNVDIGESAVKVGQSPLNPSTAPCWANQGVAASLAVWRADVLRHLPASPSGKREANGQHTVQLLDSGTGNQEPKSSGGSLIVVFRHPDWPLTGIVLYDGFHQKLPNATMLQTLQGFYERAPNAVGKLTHNVSTGHPNPSERVFINGVQQPVIDPFNSSPSSQRGWTALTLEQVNLSGITTPSPYNGTLGQSVTTSVDHTEASPDECLAWAGFQFSVPVNDTDEDGLLDVWETTGHTQQPNDVDSPLLDPEGGFLPDLKAMGANPNVQDIFVEIGYMATGGYQNSVQTVGSHSHLPGQVGVLDQVAAVFQNAKPRKRRAAGGNIGTCPQGLSGYICGPIKIHFDGGSQYSQSAHTIAFKHADGSNCLLADPSGHTTDLNCLARGGEMIDEALGCTAPPAVNTTCGDGDFANYPGTVGWKSGFNLLKNLPLGSVDQQGNLLPFEVDDEGDLSIEEQCLLSSSCQRRFDRNRRHIFKYALFAHALGLIRVDANEDPILDIDNKTQPKNTSGIADGGAGGGDLMVTLGLWDDHTGTQFMQASTLLHELGHGVSLKHGGGQAVQLMNGTFAGQPNCKPNYLSIMNYSFQVKGLYLANGTGPVIDFSSQVLGPTVSNGIVNPLSEGSLSEIDGLRSVVNNEPMAYRTAWYVPFANLNELLQFTVTRYCNGTHFTGTSPLVRVEGTTVVPPIDWNSTAGTTPVQDINFNGVINDGSSPAGEDLTFAGFSDFENMDLRHTASRRNAGSEEIGGGLSLDVGFGEVGFGEVGFGEVGFASQGFGEVGFGEVGFGEVGFGEVGFGEVGFGEVGFGEVGAPQGELDLDTAGSLSGPNALKATVRKAQKDIFLTWMQPHVGTAAIDGYDVYRVVGNSITPQTPVTDIKRLGALSPTTLPTVTQYSDTDVKQNTTYTYFVVAQRPGGPTGPSNFVTITYTNK